MQIQSGPQKAVTWIHVLRP